MNVYEKLIEVQNELKAPKNQYNSFGKYNYRSCEDILEALKPVCKKHKALTFISDTVENVGDRQYIKSTVTFIDTEKGEKLEVSAYAREEETKKGMDGSQVTGASSSYARKYALNGMFCIDDTKDSDGTNTHGKDKVQVQEQQPQQQNRNPAATENRPNTSQQTITEGQIKLLFVKQKEKSLSNEDMKALVKKYGADSSKNLTKANFKKLIEEIDKM